MTRAERVPSAPLVSRIASRVRARQPVPHLGRIEGRRGGAFLARQQAIDSLSEFRFGGRPLEALQRLDRAEQVLYIGTFNKVMFPALRLGYLVAPPAPIGPLLATRRFIDVLHEGHFARHLRRMLARCRELCVQLGDLLDVRLPEAGLDLVAWPPPVSTIAGPMHWPK